MNKRNPKLHPFVPLRIDLIESAEFRNLSNKAKVIYLYMRKNSYNKIDRVKIPYGTFKDMMSTQTISNGLKELIASGLIKQISKGGMYGSPAIYNFVGPYKDPFQSRRRH